MSKLVSEIGDEQFEKEVVESNVPVLVDFWAPWCGPCVKLGPVIEELAQDFQGKVKIVKVNVSENQKYASLYNVRSIPNLLVFKGGQVANQFVGAVEKAKLHSVLASHI